MLQGRLVEKPLKHAGLLPENAGYFLSNPEGVNHGCPCIDYGTKRHRQRTSRRAIHRLSARQENPFIVINCGAIPENLLESELFVMKRRLYRAHIQRKGRFEMAIGAPLFDEIGELPLSFK